jgi:hypothetical protein
MIEDDIITRLVEFHDHIQAPATPSRLDAFRGERLVRRRRTVSVAAVAAVVVLTVGIVQASLSDGQRVQVRPPRAPSPTPTESPSTGGEWTLERIRAEGSPWGEMPTTESGLIARQYVACDGSPCEGDRGPLEDRHLALEVTQNGHSALFEVTGLDAWVSAFDEDSVLVQDSEDIWRDDAGALPPAAGRRNRGGAPDGRRPGPRHPRTRRGRHR